MAINKSQPLMWWEAEKGDLPAVLHASLRELESQHGVRRLANLHHLRLYSNRMAMTMTGQAFNDAMDGGERIRMNVVKSAIDAAVAQIATNRPAPMFLTEGGSYAKRKQALRLGRFVKGQFHALRQYELSLDIFRDACVWGTGFELVYHDGAGHICIERVLADEVFVDENECRIGKPKTLYRVKQVSKERLKRQFPKCKNDIDKSTYIQLAGMSATPGLDDPCTIMESWKLESYEGAEDGRHVLCTDNCILVDEEWERDCFPLVSFRWNTAPIGFFGQGAAEEISPIQVEINYIAQKLQKLMTLATSMVWKEKGSFAGAIDNTDFAVREYTGRPPQFQTTASVSSEYFTHLDRLYNRAYEIVGVSQLSASSKKPGGLDSGEALRVYNDIGTRRFQHTGQRWETFHMDIAEQVLYTAKEIIEAGFPLEVLAAGDDEVERINFKDVDLDRDSYVMKIHPVSIIPDTPAGKIEIMQKLAQMSPEMAPYLVGALSGIPDLEAAVKLVRAPQEMADRVVDRILERGEYMSPSPYMALDPKIRGHLQLALLDAENQGVDEERLDMLRQFLDELDILQTPPEPPPMLGGPGMPPGSGMPPGAGPMPGPGMPPGGMPPGMPPMPPPGMPPLA